MGYLIKNTAQRKVRTDSMWVVKDKKIAQELEGKGLLANQRGLALIVYSETDLVTFYNKPVLKNVQGVYTVLLKNNELTPTFQEIRLLVETALRNGVLESNGRILVPICQTEGSYATRVWNSFSKSYLEDIPDENGFNFRDTIIVKSKKELIAVLSQLELPKNETATILSIDEESKKKKYANSQNGILGRLHFNCEKDYDFSSAL